MSETVSKFARALEKRIQSLIEAALDADTDITVKVGDENTKINGKVVLIRVDEGHQVHPRMNLVEGRLNVILRAKSADVDADDINAEWSTICGVLDDGAFATNVTVANELMIYGVKITPFTHEVEDNCFKKRWVKLVNGYVPITPVAP
jgi:hypothetical protein